MTTMGLNYLQHLETNRSNLAKERETNRSNVAKERELHRSNLAQERLKQDMNVLNALQHVDKYLDQADQKHIALKYATDFVKSMSRSDNDALNSLLDNYSTEWSQDYLGRVQNVDRAIHLGDRFNSMLDQFLKPIDRLAETAENVVDVINIFD